MPRAAGAEAGGTTGVDARGVVSLREPMKTLKRGEKMSLALVCLLTGVLHSSVWERKVEEVCEDSQG